MIGYKNEELLKEAFGLNFATCCGEEYTLQTVDGYTITLQIEELYKVLENAKQVIKEKGIKIEEEQKQMANMNIWNEYEYTNAFDKQREYEQKLFRFCRDVESDLGNLFFRMSTLESKPPVDKVVVRELLNQMDIASIANEEAIKKAEQVKRDAASIAEVITNEMKNLREQNTTLLSQIVEVHSRMNEMSREMEHMRMPARIQRDSTGVLMGFYDGKWMEMHQNEFDLTSHHYKNQGSGLYTKYSYKEYRDLIGGDEEICEDSDSDMERPPF